jgi:hypothetical protein
MRSIMLAFVVGFFDGRCCQFAFPHLFSECPAYGSGCTPKIQSVNVSLVQLPDFEIETPQHKNPRCMAVSQKDIAGISSPVTRSNRADWPAQSTSAAVQVCGEMHSCHCCLNVR